MIFVYTKDRLWSESFRRTRKWFRWNTGWRGRTTRKLVAMAMQRERQKARDATRTFFERASFWFGAHRTNNRVEKRRTNQNVPIPLRQTFPEVEYVVLGCSHFIEDGEKTRPRWRAAVEHVEECGGVIDGTRHTETVQFTGMRLATTIFC